jgi:hypothetical protein
MRRKLPGVFVLALCSLFLVGNVGRGQQLLKTNGWGSLSGKVTLNGDLPDVENLVAKMMGHADKACCLNPKAKPEEKVDQTWIVDPKTKGVANVVVWIKAPKDTYFPIPAKFQNRKDEVLIDQPHCAFLPRVSAINPVYFDGAKMVNTGQPVTIRNSAVVSHNIRALGNPKFGNDGFNVNLAPKTELDATAKFKPQPLPISMNCDIHTWMAAKLYVFDHPYYAITKADGTFEIPEVPAGAEVSIMAHHEDKGWLVKGQKNGDPLTIKEGKNTIDFQINR